MKKEIKNKQIFYTCKDGGIYSKSYSWGEVKEELSRKNIELQDGDRLSIYFEEGWNEGDSARDDMYAISVYRDEIETDEEFEKRKATMEYLKEKGKKSRYEQYLKLKKEFEDDTK